jgi:hypothetical protein
MSKINAQKITTDSETGTMKIVLYGANLTYSPATDARVVGAEDGKLLCQDEEAAEELAGEMRAWGVQGARGLGCAVVFWS